MTVHELTAQECRVVLSRKNMAHLACAHGDQPYVVPVFCYYDVDTDSLFSIAATGQKIEWMRANPKVCVAVSEIRDQFNWTSVVAYGRYEELTHAVSDDDLRRRAGTLFEQRHEWWYPAMQKPDAGSSATTVVYRIRLDRMTGRRGSHTSTSPNPVKD